MDASYKIQRGIHVHLIQFFMCPEFWVHIREKMVKLVFYLLYCCAAIKSCGLSGILFKAIHSLKSK